MQLNKISGDARSRHRGRETVMNKQINSKCLRPSMLAAAVALTLGLQGCNSLPEQIDTLEQARAAVQALRQEPLAREVAPDQFDEAQQSLAAADRAYEEKEPLEIVEHNAYIALRNAQVAELMIAEESARKEVEQGEVERARVQLDAREREAARAQAAASQAQSQAEQAQALADQRGAEIERQAQEHTGISTARRQSGE